jgi:TPR repeat protein
MFERGEGISMNKSLAAHYFKFSANQRLAAAHCNYGWMLARGEGISMNTLLAVDYFTLSADQGLAKSEEIYADLGVQYMRRAAVNGSISAQLCFATLLRHGRAIKHDLPHSTHYFKLASDQISIEGQFRYAICLLCGDGVSIDHPECENYFSQAVKQGDMRAQMRLGICLLWGMFGRFEFDKARALLDLASVSNRFAQVLRDSLCQSDCELVAPLEFSSKGSIFAILRSSSNESIPLIRLLNFHLGDCNEDDRHQLLI